MQEFNQTIDEKYFNMLWRALSERVAVISQTIENKPDSDETALMSNDLVYLRCSNSDLIVQLPPLARVSVRLDLS